MSSAMRSWTVIGGTVVLGVFAAGCAAAEQAAVGKPAAGLTPELETRILSVLDDMDKHQRQGMMNATVEDGRLLRVLTQATGAKRVVEIGTSNGYSGIWFCLGLKATGGKLITHEIDAERAALARKNFDRAGVADLVTLVEGDAHETVKKLTEPIDILFLDADKSGYIDYLNKLLPLLRPGGLVLAHNTTDLGSQMKDYLQAVTHHPDLETIFLHEHDRGIGVSMKKWADQAPAKPAASQPADARRAEHPAGAILGYINHVPPEDPAARESRHQRIAERRKGIPIIVHRGDRKSAPENTLEAYASAMNCGADGVEFDIRRSKDGVFYLLHDDTLERMTNGSGKARDKTYYELLQAGIKGGDKNARIPTLAAFLVLARQRAMLLHLDVKEPGLQDDIERVFDEADVWDHVVEVNAGNAERLREHPKVKLIPYRGGWPKDDSWGPDAVADWLKRDGVMAFCEDPRHVVKRLGRNPVDPVPLPTNLRALLTPEGIVAAQR